MIYLSEELKLARANLNFPNTVTWKKQKTKNDQVMMMIEELHISPHLISSHRNAMIKLEYLRNNAHVYITFILSLLCGVFSSTGVWWRIHQLYHIPVFDYYSLLEGWYDIICTCIICAAILMIYCCCILLSPYCLLLPHCCCCCCCICLFFWESEAVFVPNVLESLRQKIDQTKPWHDMTTLDSTQSTSVYCFMYNI